MQDLWAWAGGAVVFTLILSTRFLIGHLYSEAKALEYLRAIEQPALFFGSALATASTTSLALMLTMLSFTHRLDADFDDEFFHRIYRIALYSTVTMCGSVLLIVVMVFPQGEFEAVSDWLYPKLYTGVVVVLGALAATIFVTVLLIFSTVRRVIVTLHSGGEAEGTGG